jgi:hypothetical protein
MTTAEKIAAIETSTVRLGWDLCHKIYLLTDGPALNEALSLGYNTFAAKDIRYLIGESCFLVFVSKWGGDGTWEHPWNIEQGTQDIYTAAASSGRAGMNP